MAIRNYRDLKVWQVGVELTMGVYEFTRGFPNYERYGLASQLQRAAVSIPANVAEGHGRSTTKQFLYHVSVARGSVCELETLLTIAQQLEYDNRDTIADVLEQCDRVGRMLTNLRKRLKAKLA